MTRVPAPWGFAPAPWGFAETTMVTDLQSLATAKDCAQLNNSPQRQPHPTPQDL
jgi:hypothetical protein